jgi:hypothetical protein
MSTRALGTAGSLAEIDSHSPLNPAALGIGGAGDMFMQYDPEIRTVSGASGTSRTTTSRIPNIGFTMPLNRRLAVGGTASSFFDRTWATQAERIQTVGNKVLRSDETFKSDGGISDLRLALAYVLAPRVRIGVGAHYYAGSAKIQSLQRFSDTSSTSTDTTQFGNVIQNSSYTFAGKAVSAGIDVDVLPHLSIAVSGRKGGTIRMSAGDTLLTTANIPNHFAGAVHFDGIPGTIIAARFARDQWSSLTALSTSGAKARDGNDISAGLESAGPRTGAVVVRLGVRRRVLPFEAAGQAVTETSFGGGFGVLIAQNRAGLDFAVLRNSRTGVSGVTEHAYTLSFGLRLRP